MKVNINGRDLNERVEELAQREQQYFKTVQTAGYVVIVPVVFVCLSIVLHFITGGLIDIGPNSFIDAFKSLH